MTDHPSTARWLARLKQHLHLVTLVGSFVFGALGWFVSGQQAVIRLTAAEERATALKESIDSLKVTHQEDQAELVRLRTNDQAQRDSNLTCQREQLALAAQAQQAPDLKAQLDAAQAEVARLKADTSMAGVVANLLQQEKALSDALYKRTTSVGFGFVGPEDENRDPLVRQMTAARLVVNGHINALLGSRPSPADRGADVDAAALASQRVTPTPSDQMRLGPKSQH